MKTLDDQAIVRAVESLAAAGEKVSVRRLHRVLRDEYGASPSFSRLQRFVSPGATPRVSPTREASSPRAPEDGGQEALLLGVDELRRVAFQVVDAVRVQQNLLEAQESRLSSIEAVLRNALSAPGTRDVAENVQLAQLKEELRKSRAAESDLASRVFELQRRLATYEDF